MQFLTFVFKALATSGLGPRLAGLAVVFGAASQTQADPCFGIAGESHGSHETPSPCEWRDHKPAEYWWHHYFHYSKTPADSSGQTLSCAYLTSTCGPSTAGPSATTAVEAEAAITPSTFVLGANYPNPFNPATTIPFVVPAGVREVDLTIYNILGQPVYRVWNGSLAAGEHRLAWDGQDAQGQLVAAGVYLYRLQVGNQTRIRKMVKIE